MTDHGALTVRWCEGLGGSACGCGTCAPARFYASVMWCVAEGELETSPMVGMKPPQLRDEPPPVLTDDQLRRLLKSYDGRDFTRLADCEILPDQSAPAVLSLIRLVAKASPSRSWRSPTTEDPRGPGWPR